MSYQKFFIMILVKKENIENKEISFSNFIAHLKNLNIIVIIILTTKHVTIGKQKVNLSFFNITSPGIRPMGSSFKNGHKRPMTKIIRPI